MDADEIPNSELGQNPCKFKCNVINHSLPVAHVMLAGISGLAKELLTDFADSLPGIDEAKSFMQVMG